MPTRADANRRISFEAITKGAFAQMLAVPEAGFRWVSDYQQPPPAAQELPGPWLIDPTPVGEVAPLRRYAPFGVAGLHRRFARVKPTQDGFLAFANRYGQLDELTWLVGPSGRGVMYAGESLEVWRLKWAHVRMLVELWDAVLLGQARLLRAYFQWPDANAVRYTVAVGERGLDASAARNPLAVGNGVRYWAGWLAGTDLGTESTELLAHWQQGDVVGPARHFVCEEVNNAVRGHVQPAVLPFRGAEIRFFPDTLLTAIYIHLMLEISQRPRPALMCAREGCANYFTPRRRDQIYCSDGCKKLAYYYRHHPRKAREAGAPAAGG
jgi:hypothetical protein